MNEAVQRRMDQRADTQAQERVKFELLVKRRITLEPDYLVDLLQSLCQRLPHEIENFAGRSPSSRTESEAVEELDDLINGSIEGVIWLRDHPPMPRAE